MDERIAVIEAKERALVALKADTAGAVGDRTPWFCSRLPAQHLDQGARRLARGGRHRLPLHGDLDGPLARPPSARWAARACPGSARRRSPPTSTSSPTSATAPTTTRACWRSASASRPSVNITYKILFNDAVAMTGGQPVDGTDRTCPTITRELEAEGVKRIVVVTDEPERYNSRRRASPRARRCTTATSSTRCSASCARSPGVTVIIYDQTCATEKRRRRKRGTMAQTRAKRVVINELVCEGCGDCSVQSNCLSVEPVETEFGRKRRINQNTCNKDFSCAERLLPELRDGRGRQLKKAKAPAQGQGRRRRCRRCPMPTLPIAETAWGIVVAGIGGTGVITIGQLLGMAAHLEGKGVDHAGRRRPRAKGRRDLEPHPDRQHAGRDPHDQGRRGQGRPGDRLRGRSSPPTR